jgi:methionine-rich copper-binding protein CopC
MRLTILAAAATIALASPAFAQTAIPPSDPTNQAAGGKASADIAAPTGNIAGSATGAANMNGPNGNGTTDREQARVERHGYVDQTNGTLIQPNSAQINH